MNRTYQATAKFHVKSWDETIIADIDGEGAEMNGTYYPKRGFSRADVTYAYSGALEGTSSVAYLISYREGAAPVVAFERFEGSLDGRAGSFVMQHAGEQDTAGVRETLTVVEGLGTGDLASLRGKASIDLSGHSDDGFDIALDYDM
ncbi:DUF3224 domain-containing protein [Spelaeicoccus albus]|uniref:DUF3224 domain-containing protein n=1 Tax=Spelaeicoccus albus TaxID=1280376 RepID=A0A7Z0AA66_9MICO|nr:DUF3224 domain-containing protein [Spelaeicoccus albus]NYI66408.1 hypothetical protein [Spelaeicoccus albus]